MNNFLRKREKYLRFKWFDVTNSDPQCVDIVNNFTGVIASPVTFTFDTLTNCIEHVNNGMYTKILICDSLSFYGENFFRFNFIPKQLVRYRNDERLTDQLCRCLTQRRLPLLHPLSHHIHILPFQSFFRWLVDSSPTLFKWYTIFFSFWFTFFYYSFLLSKTSFFFCYTFYRSIREYIKK